MTRSEFTSRRKVGIGGSDIAAIAGLSAWRSPLDVYYDKMNTAAEYTESYPVGETAALYWGSVHEAAIGKAYTAITGRKIQHYNRLLSHPEKPYFIGDVDFLAYCSNGSRPAKPQGEILTDKGIECKTARYASEEWGESGTDEIPLQYLCQVQWYMGLIPSIQSFDLVVLFAGSDLRIYTVNRDDNVISKLHRIGERFWHENILQRVPPPPRSIEEVQRLKPVPIAKSKLASAETETKCRELAKVSANRLELEKTEKQLKTAIALEMADTEELILPDNTVIATFKNERNSRVFRLKKIK